MIDPTWEGEAPAEPRLIRAGSVNDGSIPTEMTQMQVRAARLIALSVFALAGAVACGLASIPQVRTTETLAVMIGGAVMFAVFAFAFLLDCTGAFEGGDGRPKVCYLLAWRDIAAGTVVSDFRVLFEFGGEVPAGSQPPGALTVPVIDEFETLNGKTVRRDLKKGDVILVGDVVTDVLPPATGTPTTERTA